MDKKQQPKKSNIAQKPQHKEQTLSSNKNPAKKPGSR